MPGRTGLAAGRTGPYDRAVIQPGSQLDDVVRLLGRVLGDGAAPPAGGGDHDGNLVGVYAHGSAVLAGLRPFSDLDVLAVVRRRTTAATRRALVDGLLRISGPVDEAGRRTGAARPVELTVVAQADVRPWRYPPRCEFQYGEWLRAACRRGETPAPAPSPDLAVLITMALAGDAPVVGPPPAEVFAPVPRADLTRALVAGVPELVAEVATDTRNVLLTLARIWRTLETGEITSKDAAAAWALDRLPAGLRPALGHARAAYLGEERESWRGRWPAVRALADHLRAAIDRAARAA